MAKPTRLSATFSSSGVTVAKLTAAMKKSLRLILPFLLAALPAAAQDWSVGVATGPFVFGDFAERTVRATAGGASEVSKFTLTAAIRPGLVVDLEHQLGDRLAFRVEGTFTEAKLKVETDDGSGVDLDAGRIDVTTLMVPLVFRINPHGSFRFHLMAGPAYAMYRIKPQVTTGAQLTPFDGSRSRFGGAAGAGLAWWWSGRFAVEGQITDIVTSSPFEKSDFAATGNLTIPKPHNVHTSVGIRYKF
jgi:opacity protein-like surface antigen